MKSQNGFRKTVKTADSVPYCVLANEQRTNFDVDYVLNMVRQAENKCCMTTWIKINVGKHKLSEVCIGLLKSR